MNPWGTHGGSNKGVNCGRGGARSQDSAPGFRECPLRGVGKSFQWDGHFRTRMRNATFWWWGVGWGSGNHTSTSSPEPKPEKWGGQGVGAGLGECDDSGDSGPGTPFSLPVTPKVGLLLGATIGWKGGL